eukprot:g15899.t1
MDYVRLELLKYLSEFGYATTVSPSFNQLGDFLGGCRLLITYTAGPIPTEKETQVLESFLVNGGTWFSLHGSSGGFAEKPRAGEGKWRRIKAYRYHDIMGAVFKNHPPHLKFTVDVSHDKCVQHLTSNLPTSFETIDELYLLELRDAPNTNVFLSVKKTDEQVRYPLYGFKYDDHPALEGPNGSTLALGYEKYLGLGKVIYISLGHAHSELQPNGGQLYVHKSANVEARKPHKKYDEYFYDAQTNFTGSWSNAAFQTLIRNVLQYSLSKPASRL